MTLTPIIFATGILIITAICVIVAVISGIQIFVRGLGLGTNEALIAFGVSLVVGFLTCGSASWILGL